MFEENELKRYKNLAEEVYNMSVVVDFFCNQQQEYEHIANITPIIKQIRICADKLLANFINRMN